MTAAPPAADASRCRRRARRRRSRSVPTVPPPSAPEPASVTPGAPEPASLTQQFFAEGERQELAHAENVASQQRRSDDDAAADDAAPPMTSPGRLRRVRSRSAQPRPNALGRVARPGLGGRHGLDDRLAVSGPRPNRAADGGAAARGRGTRAARAGARARDDGDPGAGCRRSRAGGEGFHPRGAVSHRADATARDGRSRPHGFDRGGAISGRRCRRCRPRPRRRPLRGPRPQRMTTSPSPGNRPRASRRRGLRCWWRPRSARRPRSPPTLRSGRCPRSRPRRKKRFFGAVRDADRRARGTTPRDRGSRAARRRARRA